MIASTNLIERLDPAGLRRFDMKIRFDYLGGDQVAGLLHSWCRRLGLPPPSDDALALARKAEKLTPGDFAAVARRHRFQPFADARELLEAVCRETTTGPRGLRAIGFGA